MRTLFLLLTVSLCAVCGCSNEDVVARYGDFEVTVDALRFEVERLGPSYRFDGSYESRVKLVENLGARHFLAAEAVELGIAEGVETARKEAEETAVGGAYIKWRIDNSVRVPRISSLKWRPKLKRKLDLKDVTFRARFAADEAMADIMAGASYEDLQAAYADDEGVIFTDMGWKEWRDLDVAITKYVFPLEIGQFSSVVNSRDGYHLYYLANAEPARVQDQVLFMRSRRFERMMNEEKLERWLRGELMARYDFEPVAEGVDAAMEAFRLAFSRERPSREMLETTVATYSGGSVLVADLFNFYFTVPPQSRFYPGDPYGIVKAAWDTALPALYTRAGYDLNLDKLYEVSWMVDKAVKDYLVPQMEDYFRSQIEITDEDIEQYYVDRKEDLVNPKAYRAKRILLESESEVARVLSELQSGRDFAAIAQEYSKDEYTAPKGGDMGFINQGIIAVYDSLVNGMQVGDVSGPFATNAGIEFLKLEETMGGGQLTFEEAIPFIETFIRNQTANDMLSELVEKKKEEEGFFLNEDLLSGLWLPEAGSKRDRQEAPED